jgi:hypothetical protein
MPIWCLPGGLPDHWSELEPGFESPKEVSRRELLEEAVEEVGWPEVGSDRSLKLLEQFELEYAVEGVSFCNHVSVYRTTMQHRFRGQKEFRGGQKWVSLTEFRDGVQPDGRFYHMLKVGPTGRWREIVKAVAERHVKPADEPAAAEPAAEQLSDRLARLSVAEK